jgi:hypothetical protein
VKARILGLVKQASNSDVTTFLRQRPQFERALGFWEKADDFTPPPDVDLIDLSDHPSWCFGAHNAAADFVPTHVALWGHAEPWNCEFRTGAESGATEQRGNPAPAFIYCDNGFWPGTLYCCPADRGIIRRSWVPGASSAPANLDRLRRHEADIYAGCEGPQQREPAVLIVPQYSEATVPSHALPVACGPAAMMQWVCRHIPAGYSVAIKSHPRDPDDSWMREAHHLGVKVVPRGDDIYPWVACAAAVVTADSMVGLHAMLASTPVLALGQAYYGGIAGVMMPPFERRQNDRAPALHRPDPTLEQWLSGLGPALERTLATVMDRATAEDFCCHTFQFCEEMRP